MYFEMHLDFTPLRSRLHEIQMSGNYYPAIQGHREQLVALPAPGSEA